MHKRTYSCHTDAQRPSNACALQGRVCLETLLAGNPYEVVFVEYNPNSYRDAYHPTASPVSRENSEELELLLRSLMQLPYRPQVRGDKGSLRPSPPLERQREAVCQRVPASAAKAG